MKEKVTKNVYSYPEGFEPNHIVPSEYSPYRFALGRKGETPLIVICMNPSAAQDSLSDKTINRIINISRKLNMDGWMVFNLYPERATDSSKMGDFKQDISNENIQEMKNYIIEHKIKEVWGAWGDDNNIDALIKGKAQMKSMFLEIGVKVYYYGTLTKMGNPRHPLQRHEKWDFSKKEYLNLE